MTFAHRAASGRNHRRDLAAFRDLLRLLRTEVAITSLPTYR